ncbi:hypothetical protein JCM8097_001588 [Rhodosporidiobolus ruineniae]
MSSLKNVVVVGLGLSAVPAVQQLAKDLPSTHRLVIVTANDGYWPIAALRAVVVPGWETKPVAAVDKILPAGSRHVLITGTSVVELKEHSVVLDKAHPQLGGEIAFDYAILATGSSYPFPCRPIPGATTEETVTALKGLQADIASSSSVLVIGGGPVGIELAGEVAAYYTGEKKKQVTLVHSHSEFFYEPGWKPKFNASLGNQLHKMGVKVIRGQKIEGDLKTGKLDGMHTFTLASGDTVKADFVFVAHGNSPNTWLLSQFDPSTVNGRKQAIVNDKFQLAKYDHIFAIGDITDLPESKLFALAQNHGPVAAKNILAKINSSSSLKSYSPNVSKMIGVSIGPSGGAGQFFGMVFPPWLFAYIKSKGLFVDMFKKLRAERLAGRKSGQREARPPPASSAVSPSIKRQLEELGVEVVMGRRVVSEMGAAGKLEGEKDLELDNGEKVKAAFLFIATGSRLNTSFVAAFDFSTVNQKGEVRVKPTLQLDSSDGRHGHLFAIGDITDLKEGKLFAHGR